MATKDSTALHGSALLLIVAGIALLLAGSSLAMDKLWLVGVTIVSCAAILLLVRYTPVVSYLQRLRAGRAPVEAAFAQVATTPAAP